MMPPDTMPTIADGDGQRARCRNAGGFEQRRKRQPGRGAAGQRHRSGEHAHQRMLPQRDRAHDADDVLRHGRQRRDRRRTRSTSGPPTRSSDTLAPKPTDVKNAIISGVCSVVSSVTSVDAASDAPR